MRINLTVTGEIEKYLEKFPKEDRAGIVRYLLLSKIEEMGRKGDCFEKEEEDVKGKKSK